MPRTAALFHLAVTVGFAAALLALGLPQTVDSAMRLYAGGEDVTAAGVASIPLLDAADRWFDDPEARIVAGMRKLSAATAAPAASAEAELLRRAVDDLSSGLSREPASARGWTALAEARLLQRETDGAVDALHVSLLVASYDQSLSLWRSELGFALWMHLDAEDRSKVLEQVRVAWNMDPNALVAAARQQSRNILIARIALADEPEPRRQFEEFLGRR